MKELPHDHGGTIDIVLQHMPEPEFFSESAEVFQQLGDSSRLRILWILCHCEECVNNIAAAVGMSNAAVSHHLKSLRLHGIITSRRAGKEVYYTLADTSMAHLTHKMIDDFFQITCPTRGINDQTEQEA